MHDGAIEPGSGITQAHIVAAQQVPRVGGDNVEDDFPPVRQVDGPVHDNERDDAGLQEGNQDRGKPDARPHDWTSVSRAAPP